MTVGDRYRVTGNTGAIHLLDLGETVTELGGFTITPDYAAVQADNGRKQFVARADLQPLPTEEKS